MRDKISPDLSASARKKWYLRWWVIVIFAIALISAILMAYISVQVYTYVQKVKRGEIILNSGDNANIVNVSADDDPSWGNPEAKVKIIAFEDFECPFCGEVFPIIRELLDDYGDRVYFTYRDFPVGESHPNAQKAAEAAQCANDQGAFWLMHDKIFQNQQSMTVADLKSYAVAMRLDDAAFNSCLDGGKYRIEVKKDLSDGLKAGVNGTPTFFINGYKFEGVIPLDAFKQIISLYENNN